MIAGDDDEVYDKKPQRYAVVNLKPKNFVEAKY